MQKVLTHLFHLGLMAGFASGAFAETIGGTPDGESFRTLLFRSGYHNDQTQNLQDHSEYELGLAAYYNKEYATAIIHFQNAQDTNPFHADACYYMAQCYLALNDLNNAIAAFYRAVAINPNHTESYFYLGNACYLTGDYSQALQNYRQVEAQNTGHADLYNNIGLSYMNLGDYAQAELYMKKALINNPDNYNAHTSLAVLFLNRKDYSTSEYYNRRTIEIEPNNPTGYYNMACLFSVQNRTDEALGWLEQALTKGYKDWVHISKDKDLDNIRDTQRFMNLRLQYDSNAGY